MVVTSSPMGLTEGLTNPTPAAAAARKQIDKRQGRLAQLVRAPALQAGGHWFEPSSAYHKE